MHNHSGLFLNYVAECGVIHQNFWMAWLLDTLFAILVSPSISPGEKAVMRNAFDRGTPLIILQENGSADLAKPGGRRMDACAEGRLLILAPWQHHNERLVIRRDQCLQLNEMVRMICANT